MGYGDRLAGGGRSATFPAAPQISEEKWRKIWEEDEKTESSKVNGEQLRKSPSDN